MEWMLFIFYFLLFLYLLKKWNFFNNTLQFPLLAAIFIIKIAAGAFIAFIYSHFYKDGDTYSLMKDVNLIFGTLSNNPSIYFQFITGLEIDKDAFSYYYQHFKSINVIDFNKSFKDPLIMLRFNSFLCIFTFGYYYVQLLFMCLFSMIGLTALYKTALKISGCNEWLLITACFGIPSVLAWGSSVLKEPMILFLLGTMIFSFYNWLGEGKKTNGFLFIATGLLLFGMKPYIAISLLPGMVAWWIYSKRKNHLTLTILATYLLFFLGAIILSNISIRLNIFRLLNDQQIIYMKNAVFYPANSLVELIPFAPSPVSVVRRIPDGLLMSLTRPYFSECKNKLQQLSALENWMVLAFIGFLLFKLDIKKLHANPLAQLSIISGLLILVIAAYTTPVLGTLVRIKMPGVLLLLFGLAAGSKISKINFTKAIK